MAQTITSQVEALLIQAEHAHGQYERSVLNGVYDQNWASWYAQYTIDQGISQLLGRQISLEQLSQFLSHSYEQFKTAASQQSWAAYTAQKLVEQS